MKTDNTTKHHIKWKLYLKITAESLLAFYLATFSLALFFKYRGEHWIVMATILILLYLFVIFVCARNIFKNLPLASVMLIIPIAPFIALTIVISLIPVLQYF